MNKFMSAEINALVFWNLNYLIIFCFIMSTKKIERFLKKCATCSLNCYSHPQFVGHQRSHFHCLICDYTGEDLKNHLLRHAKVEETHGRCPLCNELTNEIVLHINFHFRVPLECPYDDCDKTYVQKSSLNRHIKSFHLKVYNFICKECHKTFSHRNNFSYHLQAHVRKKQKMLKSSNTNPISPLYCDTCHLSFKRLFDYYNHLEKHHLSHFLSVEEYKLLYPLASKITAIEIIEEQMNNYFYQERDVLVNGTESIVDMSPEKSRPGSPYSTFQQRGYI
eukprot:NODE_271_length_12205_cov_0.703205.p6 type:complete len:278 gc:universal NODE_271_length_12205_cov_0.703205:1801-968(-)